LFDDIENTPIVRQRMIVVDASLYIFLSTIQRENAAPFPILPVPAGPGDCIEVKSTSPIEPNSVLGTATGAEMQAGTTFRLVIITIVSVWDVPNKAPSFSRTIRSFNLFARCRTMKPGDTVVERNPSVGDAGGCYVIRMGILLAHRTGYGTMRFICLTPPQVFTNEVNLIKNSSVHCTGSGQGSVAR
jgi:hypothetical protein